MNLNVVAMIESLSIMEYGMLGIFVAIGSIMLAVKIIEKLDIKSVEEDNE